MQYIFIIINALPSADLFVYYPSKRDLSARTRAFIDFLMARFA